MRKVLVLLAALAIAASAAFIGYVAGRSGLTAKNPQSNEEEPKAVPKVKAVPATQADVEDTVLAYGTVIASPEDVQSISVPFEARVRRVLVAPGQAVSSETPVVEVEPSPDARLQLQDAQAAFDDATKDLANVTQRLELKLATKSDLLTAQQALHLAKDKLDSLLRRAMEPKQVPAGAAGLVSRVDVQEGQILAASASLVEVVPADRIQVRLGVDPTYAAALKPNLAVRVRAVGTSQPEEVTGHVRLVTARMNQSSRLMDVYVELPAAPAGPRLRTAPASLLLESYVTGRIVLATRRSLVVPRPAVLPEDDKFVVYVVARGKAAKREVQVGVEDGNVVEIVGGDLRPGEIVVVEGNYELEDGMEVELAGPATDKE